MAFLILMGFAGALPVLMVIAGIMALILAIVALLTNGIKWARIPNRKFGAGVGGAALVLVMAGGAMAGTAGAVGTAAVDNELAVAEPFQTDLASHVGEPCDFDYQVMTQGGANNYCDENASGALVWVDQGTHDRTEAVLASARESEAKKKVEEAEAAKAKASAEAVAAEAMKATEAAESKKSEEAMAAEENEITEPIKTKAAEVVKAKEAAKPKKSETAAPAKPKQSAEARAAKDKEAAEAKAAKKAADAKAARAAETARQKKAAEKKSQKSTANTYYRNCTAVRNAGAAPIYRGQPGYSSKLDRDGDGVGCEN